MSLWYKFGIIWSGNSQNCPVFKSTGLGLGPLFPRKCLWEAHDADTLVSWNEHSLIFSPSPVPLVELDEQSSTIDPRAVLLHVSIWGKIQKVSERGGTI